VRGLSRIGWELSALRERLEERRGGIVVGRPLPAGTRARPLVVVSPHLDDAVLSCGQLLAGSPGATVLTVFTRGPEHWGEPTAWDRSCGFGPGDDVMAARQAEDRRALALVGATPRWLGLVECQYGQEPLAAVLAALDPVLADHADADVVLPLGLHQPDHLTLGAAVPELVGRTDAVRWWAYADLPYARLDPGEVDRRLAALATAGVDVTPDRPGPAGSQLRKRAAIRRYRSQVRALRGSIPEALTDERYWRLTARVRPGRPPHPS
jgi:LmbE family N-acetylglucosaminyl deacetylase